MQSVKPWLAENGRRPGARLIWASALGLAVLALATFYVSFRAQFTFMYAVKHQDLPALIEALIADVAMVVCSLLALGMACAGQSAKVARLLVIVFAGLSAGMNYLARPGSGVTGWRPVRGASRIAPERRARRTAARTGGTIPAAWGPVIALAADFEPEDDAALLDWMNGQVTGMSGYGEALVDLYDHCTNVIGIDPAASALLHDVADAVAHAAEAMAAAKQKFTDHYELPREFAGNGGLMTHDGRWVTGEGA